MNVLTFLAQTTAVPTDFWTTMMTSLGLPGFVTTGLILLARYGRAWDSERRADQKAKREAEAALIQYVVNSAKETSAANAAASRSLTECATLFSSLMSEARAASREIKSHT